MTSMVILISMVRLVNRVVWFMQGVMTLPITVIDQRVWVSRVARPTPCSPLTMGRYDAERQPWQAGLVFV